MTLLHLFLWCFTALQSKCLACFQCPFPETNRQMKTTIVHVHYKHCWKNNALYRKWKNYNLKIRFVNPVACLEASNLLISWTSELSVKSKLFGSSPLISQFLVGTLICFPFERSTRNFFPSSMNRKGLVGSLGRGSSWRLILYFWQMLQIWKNQ